MPTVAADCDEAVVNVDRRERLVNLRQTIERLPDDLRTAFVAAVIDGYTYQEIAEMHSLPVGTVGYRVHQARHKVTAAMRELFPET